MLVISLPARSQGFVAADPSRWLGQVDEDSRRFGWPGSGFEIGFTGQNLSVVLEDSGANSLVVEEPRGLRRIDLQSGRHDYLLAANYPPGTHIFRLSRRTEGLFGPTTFIKASADGEFLALKPRERSVAVIGDSVAAGYGIEGKDPSCAFSGDTENQYLTYGALAARALDADLITLAASGRGVARNFEGGTTDTMPQIFARKVPTDPSATEQNVLAGVDVIVISLGTNDFTGGNRPDNFVDAYAAFLATIRLSNPRARIYLATGPMLGGEDAAAHLSAVRTVADVAGGAVKLLSFAVEAQGFGCDWHPNTATHQQMAQILIAALHADLGW